MRAGRYSTARTVGVESLETRRLFALSFSPLQSVTGVRFTAIQTDSSGNVFAIGDFQGQTTFDKAGKIKFSPLGDSDAFIMRVAAKNGATVVRRLGSTSAQSGLQKIVSPSKLSVQDGHVTVVGTFTGHVDFDPTKGVKNGDGPGAGDGFVLDLSASSLNFNWSTTFGGAGSDAARSVDRDSKGNTWVSGYFQNTMNFPGATVHKLKSAGSFDAFVAKYSPTGQYLFSARFGAAGDDIFQGLAVDGKDNVFLAGQFQKTVDTNPGSAKVNLSTAGTSTSGMLIELGNAGTFKASRGYIDSGFGALTDVEVDTKNNVYVLGNYDGSIDVDPTAGVKTLASKGFGDVWISKLDSALKTVWSNTFGGTGADQGQDLYIDSKGQILISGSVENKVDLNPSKATAFLTSDGQSDIFVSSYSAGGKFLGAAQIGGAGGGTGVSIARSGSKYVLAANFQGSIDLSPRKLPPGGTSPIPSFFDSQTKVLCDIILVTPGTVGAA